MLRSYLLCIAPCMHACVHGGRTASCNIMTLTTPWHDMQAIDDATGPALWVVSEADAVLEAQQLQPGRQVYEGRVTQGVVRLEPGDVVVDVGANVGSFARYAAQQVRMCGALVQVCKQNCALHVLQDHGRTQMV